MEILKLIENHLQEDLGILKWPDDPRIFQFGISQTYTVGTSDLIITQKESIASVRTIKIVTIDNKINVFVDQDNIIINCL